MYNKLKSILKIIISNIKNNIKSSILIVSFPVIMLLLLGPVEIYYSNMTDFDFTIKEFFLLFLIIAFVVLVVAFCNIFVFIKSFHIKYFTQIHKNDQPLAEHSHHLNVIIICFLH